MPDASKFLLEDALAEDVLAAIRTVCPGDAMIGTSAAGRLLQHVARDLPVAGQDDALAVRPTGSAT